MKSLSQQYDQLIDELQSHQAGIAHQSRAVYHEYQRETDARGVKVIAFEVEHKIDEGRRLHQHAMLVLPQLAQFEAMLEHYKSEPLPINPTTATAEELETATEQRSALVLEVKKSVKTLSRMRDDIIARRKAIRPEAMVIAEKRDELSAYERTVFEELYLIDRPNRATREAFSTIPNQELATV